MSIAGTVQAAKNLYDQYYLKQPVEKVNLATKGDIRLTNLFCNSNIAAWSAKSAMSFAIISTLQNPSSRFSILFRNTCFYTVWVPTLMFIDHLTWAFAYPVLHWPVIGRLFHNALFDGAAGATRSLFDGGIKITADLLKKANLSNQKPELIIAFRLAFTAAKIAVPIFLAIVARKQLFDDVSLIKAVVQGVLQKQDWWCQIDERYYLSGIPLQHQKKELEKLGITHVLRVMEQEEIKQGILEPYKWAKDIWTMTIVIPSHQVITSKLINRAIASLNSATKILIHCESGNNRSAAIVAAHLLARKVVHLYEAALTIANLGNNEYKIEDDEIKKALALIIKDLQQKRPQISISALQQNEILTYIKQFITNQEPRAITN